jgi:hypothetical protein
MQLLASGEQLPARKGVAVESREYAGAHRVISSAETVTMQGPS